jgi:ATP-dependent DNA helicase RecG
VAYLSTVIVIKFYPKTGDLSGFSCTKTSIAHLGLLDLLNDRCEAIRITVRSMNRFCNSIQIIRGIGPKKAALFSKLGITTIEDALNYFPRVYEHRGPVQTVESIREGMVALCLQWKDSPRLNRVRRGFSTVIWKGYDETGTIECIWFNQPYRANIHKFDGKRYYVFGKAVKRPSGYQIQNPIVEEYKEECHDNSRYLPVYPLVKGLTQRDARQLTKGALKILEKVDYADEMDRYIVSQYEILDKVRAWQSIHNPQSEEAILQARKRLVFEELLQFQIAIQYFKKRFQENKKGLVIPVSKDLLNSFLQGLPFKLTCAQNRVLDEVLSDLESGKVMNRLIQGDVGSGKTVISVAALFFVAKAGYQSVMIAPTEILAAQHLQSLSHFIYKLGSGHNLRFRLLTGNLKETEKEEIKEALRNGEIDILIGTHAVIQSDVVFSNLGLVITDEQHRFGVRQKEMLQNKGKFPHMLVMSATPIPRTLAHIVHGDMEISVIDALPPGRVPIKTYLVHSGYQRRIYSFVKKHALQGNQTYIVCPLVEESEKFDLRSAEEVYQELTEGPLKGIKTGLLHGRLSADKKERIVQAFKNGEIQVLVTTLVIEVGINVPNAIIMIIENADRFGLAQLHQLRGRVGRGGKSSYCILVTDTNDAMALTRLRVLLQSNDGFEISEKDLELRGPGDLYGLRQHGMPHFKIANPVRDHNLFKAADGAAKEIVKHADKEQFSRIIKSVMKKQSRDWDIIAVN